MQGHDKVFKIQNYIFLCAANIMPVNNYYFIKTKKFEKI